MTPPAPTWCSRRYPKENPTVRTIPQPVDQVYLLDIPESMRKEKTRKCPRCQTVKLAAEYRSGTASGMAAYCRSCEKEYQAEYYERMKRENTTGESRVCKDCKAEKPIDDFPIGSGKKGRKRVCRLCNAKRLKAYYATTRERQREGKLVRKYGMTLADYERMLTEQGGVCKGCGLPPIAGGQLVVDHNHTTGVVRGLLCNLCNRALGLVADDPDRLRGLIRYLQECPK